jgi:hypothetical protein
MTRSAAVTPLLLLALTLGGCDKSSTPAAAGSDAAAAQGQGEHKEGRDRSRTGHGWTLSRLKGPAK